MKLILLAMSLSLLSGCGKFQRVWTSFTGDLQYKCSKTGVTYVQSDSGIALLVDKDMKPILCTGNE